MKKRVVTAVVLAIAAHWHSQSLAQSGALISNNDLSKESENPVTRLIMLPLRYEGEFEDGATKATKSTFEIDQAVVPFRLKRRLGADHPYKAAGGSAAAKEHRRSLGRRTLQRIYNVLPFTRARQGLLLGGWAGALLPNCNELGAWGQQMGLRPVGSIFVQGHQPVCLRHGSQQHLVFRRATWQQ
jgi:hypothetical protein